MKQLCSLLCGITVVGIFITITVYLGIFAYNNPDPAKCWVVKDLHQCQPTKELIINKAKEFQIDITDGYPMEMHKVVVAWFVWGFFAKVAFIALIVLSGIAAFMGSKVGSFCGACTTGLYIANGVVWLCFGAIWRFSSAGQIMAGDKLERVANISDEEWS